MAEQGILMTDLVDGTSIACVEAVEKDQDVNDRLIPRIDIVRGLCSPISGTPTRSGFTTKDTSYDLDNLPADLLANLIEVNDKSCLCVSCIFETANAYASIYVLPILFDSNDYAFAFLPRLSISASAVTLAGGNFYPTRMESLTELYGAHKIGLFLSYVGNVTIEGKVWGSVV